jgi:peptidyl-prolyl cis-trans isomerase B (cyclophilin B)
MTAHTDSHDQHVAAGDRVYVDYVGRFEDGTVFSASKRSVAEEHGLVAPDSRALSPLSFTVGSREVIEGIDESVVGMTVGDEWTVTVPPEKAYGEYDSDRVREYDRDTFEAMVGRPPEIGLHVEAQNDLHGDVTAIADGTVRVDFNHELAGKTLVFDLRVVDIE